MERHLTDTNALFHLCVMSHGAVNYLFFLSGLAEGEGGGCNLKEIHHISNTRGCFPVFYFFNACASHVCAHLKKIKTAIQSKALIKHKVDKSGLGSRQEESDHSLTTTSEFCWPTPRLKL